MEQPSIFRLNLLRAMYLLIAGGIALTVWPHIVVPPDLSAGPDSVIRALLGALSLLSLLGLRYPLQMLPVLLFELLWKGLWIIASGIPAALISSLDAYDYATMAACVGALILLPIAIPWSYVFQRYVQAPGDPWRTGDAGLPR